MSRLARKMFDLVEPIGMIPYSADEPTEALFTLGFSDYWDTYFAGRADGVASGGDRAVRASICTFVYAG